jgi:hypothetical protein
MQSTRSEAVQRYHRAELEQTFQRFRAALGAAMISGDWSEWADFFTEDALYIEHAMGTFHGRREIHDWIIATMSEPTLAHIESFPADWHIICEERGWIIAQFGTVMKDPGDGSRHETYCFTLLKYAGAGRWNYEEDIYNPASMQTMLEGWITAAGNRQSPSSTAGESA